MTKEVIGEIQPSGVCWAGAADYELGIVRSEAYFRMTPVASIRDIFLESGGNLRKTLSILNRDILSDEKEFSIKPEEVIEIIDWASRNEVLVVQKINGE